MSGFPWDLVALASLLGLNRFGMRNHAHRNWAYAPMQGLNLIGVGLVLVYGLPGTQGYPVVKGFVAVVIAFHIVQNFSLRGLLVQREALREKHDPRLPLEGPRSSH